MIFEPNVSKKLKNEGQLGINGGFVHEHIQVGRIEWADVEKV